MKWREVGGGGRGWSRRETGELSQILCGIAECVVYWMPRIEYIYVSDDSDSAGQCKMDRNNERLVRQPAMNDGNPAD